MNKPDAAPHAAEPPIHQTASGSAPLRVLYIAPGDYTNERRNYNQVQRVLFVPDDVAVRLLVPRSARMTVDLSTNVEVRHAVLPGRTGFYLTEIWTLLMARFDRIDVVSTTNSFDSIPAWLCRPIGGYRWVADIWDMPHKSLVTFHSLSTGIRGRVSRLAAQLKVALFRRALPRADMVIVSVRTEGLARYGIGPSKIRRFTNAIALDANSLAPGGERTPHSICYVSSLFLPDRGIDTLAAAIGRIVERTMMTPPRVFLAGRVPELVASDLARRGVAERFDLLGSLTLEDAHALMRRSEVGVLPFDENEDLAHTHPVKLLEYMACGAVVVASDLPGIREIVRPDRDGLLVAPGDSEALALALERVFVDVVLRDRLRASAYERVQSFNAAEKIRSVYAAIAETRVAQRPSRSVGR